MSPIIRPNSPFLSKVKMYVLDCAELRVGGEVEMGSKKSFWNNRAENIAQQTAAFLVNDSVKENNR